jgi:hypothetical protein
MIELVQPAESEVVLTSLEARQVLMFFFPGIEHTLSWQESSGRPLTVYQRGYAQALLVNAIDTSFAMGFVEALATAVWNNVAGAGGAAAGWQVLRKLACEFGRKALPHWFRHAKENQLKNPHIYESVRVTIARNFKSDVHMVLGGTV